jgi:hypothetical protein
MSFCKKEKTMNLKSVMLLACLAVLMLATASAQPGPGSVNFTTSSAFTVGNTTLPAGSYKIRATEDQTVFEITAASGSPSVVFEVSDVDTSNNPKTEVNFAKYGDKLVLKNFMVQGETMSYTVNSSTAERKHKKAGGKATKVSTPATKG